MRMLMTVGLPNETFNAAVKDGSVGTKIQAILDELKLESVYFTEMNGRRTIVLIVDLENPSRISSLCEPWYLCFNAEVEFHVVMDSDELQQAGLEELGKKWAL